MTIAWTDQEREYLIANRSKMTVIELATNLNRPINSVTSKIAQLKLKKETRLQVGQKINKLTILKKLDSDLYECICKCKKIIQVDKRRFYGENSIKSCGCHKKISPMLRDIKTMTPEMYSYRFLFSSYIRNARNREVVFYLTFEEFINIIKKNCSYCGIQPRPFNAVLKQKKLTSEEKEKYWINFNGIDRVDNTLNYTMDNVVPCCKECNYAKREMTTPEWIAYLNRLFAFLQKNVKVS